MHIAVVTGRFPVVSETFVLDQITGFIDAGHEVTIIAKPPRDDEAVHPDVDRYDLEEHTLHWSTGGEGGFGSLMAAAQSVGPMEMLRMLGRGIPAARRSGLSWAGELSHRAVAVADTPEFDVILCHFGPAGQKCQVLREVGALEGPLAVVFHGYDMSLYLENNGEDVYERLFETAELLLPISDHWKERLVELGAPKSKTVVHHMGVDPERFSFRERTLDKQQPVRLLTVGRFVEKKGIHYGIRAVARLVDDFPNLEYTIIGDGKMDRILEALAEHHEVTDHIDFRGWCDRSEVLEAMQNHHVLLAPSATGPGGDKEGIPVVLMEAMATGLPVVSTDHSGIPELVADGESGLLAAEKDVDDFAAKLLEMLENPDAWPQFGRCGREIVERKFAIDRLNEQLLELFEQRLR